MAPRRDQFASLELRGLQKALDNAAKQIVGNTDALKASSGGSGRSRAEGRGALPPGSGFAISSARQAFSAAGPIGSAIGNVFQGAASGGAAGALFAGATSAASLLSQFNDAGRQGAANTPLFSSGGRVEKERQFGKDQFLLDLRSKLELGTNTQPDKVKRNQQERRAREVRPVEATISQVEDFFGDVTAAGGKVSDERIRALGKVLLRQNRSKQEVSESVRNIIEFDSGVSGVGNSSNQKR